MTNTNINCSTLLTVILCEIYDQINLDAVQTSSKQLNNFALKQNTYTT